MFALYKLPRIMQLTQII